MGHLVLTPVLSALRPGLLLSSVPANGVETEPTTTDPLSTDPTETEPAETETGPQRPTVERPPAARFRDVPAGHVLGREMHWMAERGVSRGREAAAGGRGGPPGHRREA